MGGIARYLDNYVRSGSKISIALLAANVFISGFCGAIAAQAATILQPSWVYVAAGIGGYLGTEAINLIKEIIAKKAG